MPNFVPAGQTPILNITCPEPQGRREINPYVKTRSFINSERKTARTQLAKDTAEALGIAAGVQSGSVQQQQQSPQTRTFLMLHRERSQQTFGCQDNHFQTWSHQPPQHGLVKTEERSAQRSSSVCILRASNHNTSSYIHTHVHTHL